MRFEDIDLLVGPPGGFEGVENSAAGDNALRDSTAVDDAGFSFPKRPSQPPALPLPLTPETDPLPPLRLPLKDGKKSFGEAMDAVGYVGSVGVDGVNLVALRCSRRRTVCRVKEVRGARNVEGEVEIRKVCWQDALR